MIADTRLLGLYGPEELWIGLGRGCWKLDVEVARLVGLYGHAGSVLAKNFG